MDTFKIFFFSAFFLIGGLYAFASDGGKDVKVVEAASSSSNNTLSGGVKSKELRLDTSSEERLQESFINMMMALPDSMQQKFGSAMTTLGLVFSQRAELGGNEAMLKLVSGKTADEIIAEARRLTPYLKENSVIIDGRSAEAFGQSVASILVSLETQKQTKFSESLAKLMYETQKNGGTNEELIKKLDGKTADEILEMARKIDTPFDVSGEPKFKEYKIAPLSKDEVEKLNLTKGKEGEESLERSLAPNSIVE